MTKRMNDEDRFEARDRARWKAADKAYDKLCRRMDEAEKMIGELCREGRRVFYIFPVGGNYREGAPSDLCAFLLRNHYI